MDYIQNQMKKRLKKKKNKKFGINSTNTTTNQNKQKVVIIRKRNVIETEVRTNSCDHSDYILTDSVQGDRVCTGCGLVLEERLISEGPDYTSGYVQGSAPYKRSSYFAELMAQWFIAGPDIPEEHYQNILFVYHFYFLQKHRKGPGFTTKSTVKRLLLMCNRVYNERFYVKKYLERWRAILRAMDHLYKPFVLRYRIKDPMFMYRFKRIFRQFAHLFRDDFVKTKKRKALPYNYFICCMLSLLQESYYPQRYLLQMYTRDWPSNSNNKNIMEKHKRYYEHCFKKLYSEKDWVYCYNMKNYLYHH